MSANRVRERAQVDAFDSSEGICVYLDNGLEGLCRLMADRHAAARVTEEPLHAFCVLGRFFLDERGNCLLLEDAPADLYRTNPHDTERRCPAVMTNAELGICMRGEYWSASGFSLAKPDQKCALCGLGWTLKNCHDVAGDGADRSHRACYARELARRSRLEMLGLFTKAGFDPTRTNLISIPNGYWPKRHGEPPYYAAPWYLAQVDDGGTFRIGWRKRVIDIDWSDTGKDLSELFVSEDVTRGSHHIHAWGYAKAAEYLAKIVPAIAGSSTDLESSPRAPSAPRA